MISSELHSQQDVLFTLRYHEIESSSIYKGVTVKYRHLYSDDHG